MSTQPLTPQTEPGFPRLRESMGTLVVGAVLMLIGMVWILDVLDVVNLSIGVILPVSLILVGVVILAGSWSRAHGGLIVLGIILTVILSGAAAADLPLNGGLGDHAYAPTTVSNIPDRYQLVAGNLNVDLRDLDLPAGETTVNARVGFGKLTVDVPQGVAVEVHWIVSGGNVNVFDNSWNGTSLDDHYQTPGFDDAASKLIIEARMGFGDIEVGQP